MTRKVCPDVGLFETLAERYTAKQLREHFKVGIAVLKRWAAEHGVTVIPTKRGRRQPDVSVYACTGCNTDKPTIRNGVHVNCSKCGAAPNAQLARLHNLPNWPRVIA